MGWIQYHVNLLFSLHGTVIAGVGVHPSKAMLTIVPQEDDLVRNHLIAGLTKNPLGASRLHFVADLVEEVDSRRKQHAQVTNSFNGPGGSTQETSSVQPEATSAAGTSSDDQPRFAPIDQARPWPFVRRKEHMLPLFQAVFSSKWASKRTFQ